MPIIPPLLCEHPNSGVHRRSFRAVCEVCGSYWDLESLATAVAYDARYPAERGHYDSRVGALKVRTLRHWLRSASISLDGKVVCEVGFGGGSCLPVLAERARTIIGIEANASAIDHARDAGYPAEYFQTDALPERLNEAVGVWVFQDAFEHIPEPAPFVEWMRASSTRDAEILIVAPRGDSFSQRAMGRMWIHKLPDHLFHWSKTGLVEFMARRGFALRAEFFPLKFISPQMALAHAIHKAGVGAGARRWLGGTALAVPFNFGEMGLVFRRSAP